MDTKAPTSLFCQDLQWSIKDFNKVLERVTVAKQRGSNRCRPGPNIAEATAAVKHDLWMITNSPLRPTGPSSFGPFSPEQSKLREELRENLLVLDQKVSEGTNTDEDDAHCMKALMAFTAACIPEHPSSKAEGDDEDEGKAAKRVKTVNESDVGQRE